MSHALTPMHCTPIADVPGELFIAGEWRSGEAEPIAVENPSTAKVLAEVANAGEHDIADAIEAAVTAAQRWAQSTTRFRADLTAAVDGAVLAKMRNNGQSCIAANRFYVQSGIADDFTAAFVERLENVTIGDATENPDVGPLIDEGQRESVERLVAAAVEGGATLRSGGARIDRPGYFYEPTVLTDVPPDSPVLHHEIFGPVAPIVRFATEDDAVALANDTEFGLASYVFTENLDRGLRMIERLDVGMVGINQGIVSNAAAPFGGVKASGLGREGGAEGLAEYLDIRYAAIARR